MSTAHDLIMIDVDSGVEVNVTDSPNGGKKITLKNSKPGAATEIVKREDTKSEPKGPFTFSVKPAKV